MSFYEFPCSNTSLRYSFIHSLRAYNSTPSRLLPWSIPDPRMTEKVSVEVRTEVSLWTLENTHSANRSYWEGAILLSAVRAKGMMSISHSVERTKRQPGALKVVQQRLLRWVREWVQQGPLDQNDDQVRDRLLEGSLWCWWYGQIWECIQSDVWQKWVIAQLASRVHPLKTWQNVMWVG